MKSERRNMNHIYDNFEVAKTLSLGNGSWQAMAAQRTCRNPFPRLKVLATSKSCQDPFKILSKTKGFGIAETGTRLSVLDPFKSQRKLWVFFAPESYPNLKFAHNLVKDKIFDFGGPNTFGQARNLLANRFGNFRNNRSPAVQPEPHCGSHHAPAQRTSKNP